MGYHGGINLLHQKRWHTYRVDNRIRVERDEREARERAAAERRTEREQRMDGNLSRMGADPETREEQPGPEPAVQNDPREGSERRLQAEWERRQRRLERHGPSPRARNDRGSERVCLEGQTGHINLFAAEEEEMHRRRVDHDKRVRRKLEEDNLKGRKSKTLSEFNEVAAPPWYLSGADGRRATLEKGARRRRRDQKDAADHGDSGSAHDALKSSAALAALLASRETGAEGASTYSAVAGRRRDTMQPSSNRLGNDTFSEQRTDPKRLTVDKAALGRMIRATVGRKAVEEGEAALKKLRGENEVICLSSDDGRTRKKRRRKRSPSRDSSSSSSRSSRRKKKKRQERDKKKKKKEKRARDKEEMKGEKGEDRWRESQQPGLISRESATEELRKKRLDRERVEMVRAELARTQRK